QEAGGAACKLANASEERGRSSRRCQRLHLCTGLRKRLERNVYAAEVEIIFAAILQVIDDLQGGAKRIIRPPDRALFFMHIEDETSDRHRRKSAVSDQIVPVAIP